MSSPPIKVFLVEDSPVALKILENLLAESSDISVAGTACNGIEALDKIPKAQPDVICTDLLMGKMDGLELTQQIMAKYPRPILIISQAVEGHTSDMAVRLLKAGAIDIFAKPKSGLEEDYKTAQTALIHKIKILAGVKVFTKPIKPALVYPQSSSLAQPLPPSIPGAYKILAIGASTGGPQAIQKILGQLPAHFPLPVVCIQHISEGFLASLANWMNSECALTVKIAEERESLQPGQVYFAPEKHHLLIDRYGCCFYSQAAPVGGHRPSIDMTFESLAQVYGKGTIAALLTGMGRDGADGLKAIAQMGGLTIAQDEASSIIYGMPQEAVRLGAARQVLDIDAIAPFILKSLK
ncbi:MAG: chemotaxis-specific protein-glutamate methyltransferase CheB, partial [Thermosynechococcaceae cyanobacterium]